ncbi:MAG: hypothetical protein KBD07_00215 [Candidatus Omnitrophica bacterium]|nr:hypothetical protein [Candidatus Omnitrophota bacterium]
MSRRTGAWLLAAFFAPALLFFSAPGRAETELDWLSASSSFKLELHALAAEALMLQLNTPPLSSQRATRADRKLRLDARERLSDSLSTANALLSMMEIAEHSDRGQRVREVLHLWLDSARRRLADHQEALSSESAAGRGNPAADTAVFLEEVKILWHRLDRGYADLQMVVGAKA